MNTPRIIAVLAAASLLMFSGCASRFPTPAEMQAAYYGPKPVASEKLIREHLKRELFDPYSAVLESISAPVEACHSGPPVQGCPRCYGWEVVVEVNAKNRMGAYTGIQRYTYLIRDGVVVSVHRPADMVTRR